jgi:midasin
VIATSKSLRAESTPGEEEGREQRVKNLAARKRRAWIELLRELKRLGLSPTPTPDIVARVQDSSFVYALPSSHDLVQFEASLLDDSLRIQLVKADEYHYRLLSDMPSLQLYPAEHHQDISTRELQRAIGSIDSCVSLGFDSRSLIISTITSQVEFEAALLRLEQVSTTETTQPILSSKRLAELLLDLVSQVVAALTETRQATSNHQLALQSTDSAVANIDSSIVSALNLLLEDQRQLVRVLASMVSKDLILTLPSESSIFELARDHLTLVRSSIEVADCPPSLLYLVEPLMRWIRSLVIPVIRLTEESPSLTPSIPLETLKSHHITLVDSILVIAQELAKASDKDTPIEIEGELADLAIKTTGRTLQSTLAIFRLGELRSHIETFSRLSHQALSTHSSSITTVTTLLQRTIPFLRHYSTLLSRHLSSFLEWHKASLKLAYVITSVVKELAQEGFCRPSDDDGESGADAKTMDGTGMADGAGATNVSKEIEDEEQIEGLQGEVPEQDKSEEKDKENDDAVEMREDFEGELEDKGDGDKDENEDGSEDEDDSDSKVDPEEQMADVDPLDPSSVDEKFWGDESSKEKDGANEEVNQETTKSAGESEMQGKDDDAPKPQPKAEKQEEGEGEEEEAEGESKEKPTAEDGTEMDDDAEKGEDGEDGEEGDQGKDEEGKDAEEDDGDVANQDDGQKLDERMPEADNLDLPDDMQLDGDDKNDDDDLDLGSEMGGESSHLLSSVQRCDDVVLMSIVNLQISIMRML